MPAPTDPDPSPATTTEPVDDHLIWHYTTASGVKGILESGVIYATDALYLNDSRELLEALEVQRRLLADEGAMDGGEKELTVRLLHAWFVAPHLSDLEPMEGSSVTSFCEQGDLLSQWRGYGGAQGYAVGVSRSGLEASSMDRGDALVKVIYGEPDKSLEERLSQTTVLVGGERTFAKADSEAVARLKNAAFREEHEWRLVAEQRNREPLFRDGSRGLIPYIELPLDLALIQKVVVGPALSHSTAVRSIERLTAKLDANIEVLPSAVPFRI